MYRHQNRPTVITWKQFANKGYSAFASLHRQVRIGVLSVAPLGVAAAAQAQRQSSPIVTVEEEKIIDEEELAEVTVSGTMAPLTQLQSARIVSVLSRQDIEQAAVQSINDLFKLVTGVDVRQRGGFGIQTDISIDGGTFAMRRDISMGTARQRIDPREGRRPCRRIRLHGCDIDIVGLDMCRIRLVIQRELALARDLPAEDARMDVLQVEHAVQEPCMRRNVLERNAGRLTRCDCDVTVYHRVRERAADFRRDVHGACVVRSRDSRCCLRPRLGNRREQRRRVESFSARLEIHGRRRRIEADAAMHACRLPLHGSREVAADLTVREMREALNIANLDALDIDRAVFDLALSDHREVADIGAAVERCFCRLDLAAQNPDAVRQQPIGNQRKVIFGIDVRDLDIQNLAVA